MEVNVQVFTGIATLILTVSMLFNPESALYLPDYGIFVSEVGKPGVRDGRIILIHFEDNNFGGKEVFATGMIDPKGITYDRSKKCLLVADVDKVWKVDLRTREVSIFLNPSDFPKKPSFLNDILWTSKGVYISDTNLNTVFVYEDGKVKTFLKLPKPNGLALGNDGALFIASFSDPSGKVYKYKDRQLRLFAKGGEINGTDGVFFDRRRDILIVSGYWSGSVVVYDLHGNVLGIIRRKLRHPADIHYDTKKMFVFIPDMGRGKLFVYKIRDDIRSQRGTIENQEEGACSCGCH